MAARFAHGGDVETFTWDGPQITAAFDRAGTPKWEAVCGPGMDRHVEWRDLSSDETFAPMTDHRCSVVDNRFLGRPAATVGEYPNRRSPSAAPRSACGNSERVSPTVGLPRRRLGRPAATFPEGGRLFQFLVSGDLFTRNQDFRVEIMRRPSARGHPRCRLPRPERQPQNLKCQNSRGTAHHAVRRSINAELRFQGRDHAASERSRSSALPATKTRKATPKS
jgi:hypothetical protein